jgi:6-pyruvoyltetrahydropterin/6-carboxytetrahydropterin synthase
LHGHTYTLELSVAGHLDERGVVMDFAELDHVVRAQILERLDHQYLNDIIENPTAERVAEWIWGTLVQRGLNVTELRLWETRRSSVHLFDPGLSGISG